MLLKSSSFKISNPILLFVISLYSLLFAGAPDTLWTRSYKYDGTFTGGCYSVQQTNDSGFIVAGWTYIPGQAYVHRGQYVYLIRTNQSGDTLWTKIYGGDFINIAYSVDQTVDGGYIVAGKGGSEKGNIYLLRLDSNGDSLWTKTFGGTEAAEGRYVQQTFEGVFIVVGNTFSDSVADSDIYLLRLNSNGDTLWTKKYGGTGIDLAREAQQTQDSGFIIVGMTNSFGAGNEDVYLICTNPYGDTLWTRTYGGIDSDKGYSVQQISDGGYIVTGITYSYSFAFKGDVYLLHLNSNGDTLWTKNYNIENDYYDEGNSVQQTTDGGFIIVGNTSDNSSVSKMIIIRTNPNGDSLWTKSFGRIGGANILAGGYSVKQTFNGGFIVAGEKETESVVIATYLVRLDKDSTSIQQEIPSNFLNPNDFIVSNNNNNLISIRYTIQHSSPVNLSMYNISGQLVKTLFNEYKNAGDYTINFKTDNVSTGIYYFKITAGKSCYTHKAVVIK